MKRILTVFSFLILFFTGCSSQASSTYMSNSNDNMKVSEIIIYDANNDVVSRYVKKYNETGDVIKQEMYDASNNLIERLLTEYTYLDDGRITREFVTGFTYTGSTTNEPIEIYNDNQYSWDPSGKVAYITTYYDNGDSSSPKMEAYDDQNRVIERSIGSFQYYYSYSDYEKVYKVYSTTYDKLTYEITSYHSNKLINDLRKYEVSGFKDYSDSDLVEYTIYEYETNNLDYIAKTYDKDNNLISYITSVYESDGISYTLSKYDKNGNMTGASKYIYKSLDKLIG